MNDVEKETKVQYCTGYGFVYAGATWAESGYNYLGRSDIHSCITSEVSRGHSRKETSHFLKKVKMEVSQKTEGLNVRIGEEITMVYHQNNDSRNT